MEAIKKYFDSVVSEMASQNDKVPVKYFRSEVNNVGGQLFAPDWFKYMIFGRGPGKRPSLENIIAWAERYMTQPVRENKDGTFSIVSYESSAFAIATKIGREGTDIYQGKKKGVDLLGAMDKNMDELLKGIGESEVLRIATTLQSAVK